jgi:MFS family permease
MIGAITVGVDLLQQYRSLFRNRNFVLHWLAGAVSNVGDFFNSLAVIKILSEKPESLGLFMALIMIAKVLPGLLFGPVAGIVADRFPRRTVMIVSDLVRAVLVLTLVFVSQPHLIVALVFLAAVAGAFYNPASSAMLPSLVRPEELVTAGSLNVMTQRTAMLVGNAAGAAVLSVVGAHNVFYIDAATFVVSALFLAGMALPAGAGDRAGAASSMKEDLAEAIAFLRAAPVIRHLFATLGFSSLADAALGVLIVPYLTLGLGLRPETLGYAIALFGGTSVVGALAIGARGDRIAWRTLLVGGLFFVWTCMMGVVIAHSAVLSLVFMTLPGLGSGAINVGLQAAFGRLLPDKVRGRIFGAWGMLNGLLYIVGVLVAGALADSLGARVTLAGFAMLFLAAGLYGAWFLRPRPGAVPAVRELAG